MSHSFDFIDEVTLVVADKENNCVRKFVKIGTSCHEWKDDTKVEVEDPFILRCIDRNSYVLTVAGKLFLVN